MSFKLLERQIEEGLKNKSWEILEKYFSLPPPIGDFIDSKLKVYVMKKLEIHRLKKYLKNTDDWISDAKFKLLTLKLNNLLVESLQLRKEYYECKASRNFETNQ